MGRLMGLSQVLSSSEGPQWCSRWILLSQHVHLELRRVVGGPRGEVSTGRWGQSPWWAPPEDPRGLETGVSDGSFLTEEDRERIADIVRCSAVAGGRSGDGATWEQEIVEVY